MKYETKKAQNIVAISLAVILLFVLSYFVIFESSHTIHDCTGEGCLVCHELSIAESVTKQLTSVVWIACSCFLLTVFKKRMETVILCSGSERNLVLDKVRINR